MKTVFAFVFVFGFSILGMAQNTLTGKVTDEDGGAVPSASVTVEEPGKDAIIAYAISNSKGEYKVNFTSSASQVNVKVKAFNQKAFSRLVKNESQTLNISLQSEATEIKEVKLKTRLITKRGDTISYDLKNFDSQADRTLADVLKKIPGIEVNSSGAILYQGEAINKFYVNGKDLMEGGYGSVVNALPKDAVQKMEVLENHQPVKILQDKLPSESAAINIKLKNKVTMTGRGEVGVGLSPFLWNVKLTPMFFGQKNQWVVNYKTNNTGESVENERNILAFGSRWEGRRNQASQRNWISVDRASVPNVPEKRYLLNNVHYFSANLLTSPFKNKDWELKVNANYANNSIERASSVETVYEPSEFFPEGAKSSTNLTNNFYSNEAKGEVIITKNAKKGFFKNTTTWNGFWNDDKGSSRIVDSRTGTIGMDESMNSPSGMIQNSLSTIIPFKEKMINLQSYISYQKDNQKLSTVYDNFHDFDDFFGRNYARLDQNIDLSTLNANHSASVGFSIKNLTITPEAGLNLSFNTMESQLFGEGSMLDTDYQNDMKWNEINPYTQVGLNYKKGGLNLSLTLPVNFYGMDYKDNRTGESREISKTVFEPSFWGSYDFASFWKIWAFANVNYNYGNFGSLYTGNILTSPRNIGNNDNLLPENRSINFSPRLEYRNPLNNLFFNIRYSYNENESNLIAKTTIFSSGANISELAYFDNTTTSQTESAEIGKYFPGIKTNLSLNASNRDSNNYSMLVNNQTGNTDMIETKVNRQAAGLKLNNAMFSWMSVDYIISMNWNKNKNVFYESETKTSGWNHSLAAYFYPLENHTIGFYWDDLTTAQMDESFRNSFYDVSYQYTWAKKKIDFELKWLNIADKKVYETISYNPSLMSTTRSAMEIRPSQFLFTVKFNFK
ncbi:TonB-dependent receptor [Chryseobacterium sp. A321]